jgi:preprotein translocase subunit SecE
MDIKQEDSALKFDRFKWAMVWLLLGSGLAANYYFSSQVWAVRLIGWLILMCILAVIAGQTAKGRQALQFAREARMEMRKVVWPTRQETTQTTLVVALMVVVTALLLWGVDSILLWAMSFLTGQRG